MKSWKEYPYFFWNFNCISEVNGKRTRHYVWWILSNDKVTYRENWLEGCTLIARPISDLSNEEIHEIEDKMMHDDVCALVKVRYIKDARLNQMTGTLERKLADRGVYFLDQKHFGETVIDSTKLK